MVTRLSLYACTSICIRLNTYAYIYVYMYIQLYSVHSYIQTVSGLHGLRSFHKRWPSMRFFFTAAASTSNSGAGFRHLPKGSRYIVSQELGFESHVYYGFWDPVILKYLHSFLGFGQRHFEVTKESPKNQTLPISSAPPVSSKHGLQPRN